MPYQWRKLTPGQREELLIWRKSAKRPWHSPPHRPAFGQLRFHISAACYEHAAHIGFSHERMNVFAEDLLVVLHSWSSFVHAWCVLPNHYHALVETENVLRVLYELGRFHGRTSHAWNGEEQTRGRQVFHRASDRTIRSERHFWATVNYIHHNPVHHGYVKRWTQWPWSSAHDFVKTVGVARAKQIWHEYPLLDFGDKWDPSDV